MTQTIRTSICISALTISMLLCSLSAHAQKKKKQEYLTLKNDTTALWRGLALSFDLVGAIQLAVSDYGQYEGALRINLKDRWFPIVEAGLGKADASDDVTRITYSTSAPYARIGMDFNVMKNKHDVYRLYAGARYAFTSFKYDVSHLGVEDPWWGGKAEYQERDVKCTYHWVELCFGVDAKIFGPIHLGWSVRYKNKLAATNKGEGNMYYVPGYGKEGSSRLGGTFNVIIDI